MIMMTLIIANQYSDSPGRMRLARVSLVSDKPRTVHPYVDQLHRKNRQNDHQGILPRRDVWVPVLYARIIRDERMKVNGYTYL